MTKFLPWDDGCRIFGCFETVAWFAEGRICIKEGWGLFPSKSLFPYPTPSPLPYLPNLFYPMAVSARCAEHDGDDVDTLWDRCQWWWSNVWLAGGRSNTTITFHSCHHVTVFYHSPLICHVLKVIRVSSQGAGKSLSLMWVEFCADFRMIFTFYFSWLFRPLQSSKWTPKARNLLPHGEPIHSDEEDFNNGMGLACEYAEGHRGSPAMQCESTCVCCIAFRWRCSSHSMPTITFSQSCQDMPHDYPPRSTISLSRMPCCHVEGPNFSQRPCIMIRRAGFLDVERACEGSGQKGMGLGDRGGEWHDW